MSEENKALSTLSINEIGKHITIDSLLQSGALPEGLNNPEKIAAVIQYGNELGLPPMVSLNNIAFVKGKTVISSAIQAALLEKHEIAFEFTKNWEEVDGKITTEITFYSYCKIRKQVISKVFSDTWAAMERAGLTAKDIWQKYPKNMLRARVMTFGIKACHPTVMLGIYTAEEILDTLPDEKLQNVNYDENGNVDLNSVIDIVDAEIVED